MPMLDHRRRRLFITRRRSTRLALCATRPSTDQTPVLSFSPHEERRNTAMTNLQNRRSTKMMKHKHVSRFLLLLGSLGSLVVPVILAQQVEEQKGIDQGN